MTNTRRCPFARIKNPASKITLSRGAACFVSPSNRSSPVNRKTPPLVRRAAFSTCSSIVPPPGKSFQSSTVAPRRVRISQILRAVCSCLPLYARKRSLRSLIRLFHPWRKPRKAPPVVHVRSAPVGARIRSPSIAVEEDPLLDTILQHGQDGNPKRSCDRPFIMTVLCDKQHVRARLYPRALPNRKPEDRRTDAPLHHLLRGVGTPGYPRSQTSAALG